MPRRPNASLLLNIAAIVVGMFGLAYASVPLYDLFCSVTGFGGTTQTAEHIPPRALSRTVTIRFNADVNSDLPWTFEAEQKELRVRIGEPALASFRAVNKADVPLTGTSIYNVTPFKAGPYFNKTECFCFKQQTIAPGEEAHFPVAFFIDPALADDNNLDDVRTITLSYTFFKYKESP